MLGKQVVFGCNGPVGTELIRQLIAGGASPTDIRGVCRSGEASLPPGVEVVAADATAARAVRQASQGAAMAYCCIGVDYTQFAKLWPPVIAGLIEGLGASHTPLVFADNLYAYGPQHEPLVESMPATDYGNKPALRARISQQLLDADAAGQLRVALVRAADFYGPGAGGGHLGDLCFKRILRGQEAQFIGALDQPHAFTYVPDFARALISVSADSSAFGGVWHVPNAPATTLNDINRLLGDILGAPVRASTMPFWLQRALGLFVPIMRELYEMRFQWDRPYLVDHSKFASRFWADATPLQDGLRATLDWYRQLQ